MRTRLRITVRTVACLGLILLASFAPSTRAPSRHPGPVRDEAVVTTHARGTFDVTLTPQRTDDSAAGATIGRMSIAKRIHGDLEGTSSGEMLTAFTAVSGSAGYVAIEHVSGTLQGRRGTFVLQHSATMTRGVPHLTISVIPDSGTDELVGLAGTMTITISEGRHSYDFEYTIAGPP